MKKEPFIPRETRVETHPPPASPRGSEPGSAGAGGDPGPRPFGCGGQSRAGAEAAGWSSGLPAPTPEHSLGPALIPPCGQGHAGLRDPLSSLCSRLNSPSSLNPCLIREMLPSLQHLCCASLDPLQKLRLSCPAGHAGLREVSRGRVASHPGVGRRRRGIDRGCSGLMAGHGRPPTLCFTPPSHGQNSLRRIGQGLSGVRDPSCFMCPEKDGTERSLLFFLPEFLRRRWDAYICS